VIFNTEIYNFFLLQYDNLLFFIVSELLDLLLAGEDQAQAGQPNNWMKVTPCNKEKRKEKTMPTRGTPSACIEEICAWFKHTGSPPPL